MMLALLFLAVAATAQAGPVEPEPVIPSKNIPHMEPVIPSKNIPHMEPVIPSKNIPTEEHVPSKIIQVFELTELQQRVALESVGHQLRSPCLNDCYHYILDEPLYIIAQPELDDPFMVHYTPLGLNSLGRSKSTAGFNKLLAGEQPMVAILAPLGKFPFDIFPGILDQTIHVPEHSAKLIDMYRYKEAPVVAIIPEEVFKKINDQKTFIHVADMMLHDNVYRIAKDYALARRLAPGFIKQEQQIQQQLIQQQQPFQQQDFIPAAPIPLIDPHQFKFVPVQPLQQTFPLHHIPISQIPLIRL